MKSDWRISGYLWGHLGGFWWLVGAFVSHWVHVGASAGIWAALEASGGFRFKVLRLQGAEPVSLTAKTKALDSGRQGRNPYEANP